MGLKIRQGNISRVSKWVASSIAIFAFVVQPLVAANIPSAFAVGAIAINSPEQLRDAIANQATGQIWNIAAGSYAVTQNNSINTGNQTGWYLPIVKDNITINGAGPNLTTLYGSGYTANGNWATQDFIAIFGNNVTLNGFTVMSKVAGNKAVEVMGSNSTITDVKVTPNTLSMADYSSITTPGWSDWYQRWAGSIYYNHAGGTHTLEGISTYNGGVSNHGSTVNMNNVTLHSTFDQYFEADSYYGNTISEGGVTNGVAKDVFHLNANPGNIDNTMTALTAGATIELDTDLTTTKEITITKPVTIEGNSHTVTGTFDKGGSNFAVLHFMDITTGHSQVNNLIIDGGNHNIHGIQMYNSDALTTLWRVTSKNNGRSGINVNDSYAQVVDITTSNNGWHGIDVDKDSAKLLVAGMNNFNEGAYAAGPHTGKNKPDIYVDAPAPSVARVLFSTGDKFNSAKNYLAAGDQAYFKMLAGPTNLTPADSSFTNNKSFSNTWSSVAGAASYNYEISNTTNETNPDGSLKNVLYRDSSRTHSNYSTANGTVTRTNGVTGDGVYYWHVQAVDADGVAGAWSPLQKITVDASMPATSITGATVAGNTLNFSGTVTDANLNYYYCYLTTNQSVLVDGHTFTPGQEIRLNNNADSSRDAACGTKWASGQTSYSGVIGGFTITGVPDGIYTIRLVAHDLAGNNNAANPTTFSVTLDRTAPVVTVSSINDIEPGQTASINGSVDDPTVTQVEAFVDGVSAGVSTVNPDGTFSFGIASLSTGVHSVVVKASDAANNQGVSVSQDIVVSSPAQTFRSDTVSSLTRSPALQAPFVTLNNGTNDQAVLGAETVIADESTQADTASAEKADPVSTDEEVLGTADAAADKKSETAGFLGVAWYWYLLAVAALGGLWWLIAAIRRRNGDEF